MSTNQNFKLTRYHFMHYNFVRIHPSLRVSPAMAAGVTDKLWSLDDMAALLEKAAPEKRGPYKKAKQHG